MSPCYSVFILLECKQCMSMVEEFIVFISNHISIKRHKFEHTF